MEANRPLYRQGTSQAQSWPAILAFYEDLTNYGWGHQMLGLVKHIIASGLSDRLFAFTSFHGERLSIGLYDYMVYNQEVLQIEFDYPGQVFLFEYYGRPPLPREQPEFRRKYLPENVAEKFDQFICWIRW